MDISHQTPSLPNEIISDIFSYLPPPSLADLTRVSKRLSAVADHLLYSSIFIKDFLSESCPLPWRTSRCCESVISRTYRAESIKRFHIRWLRDPQSPPTRVHVAQTAARLSETLGTLTTIETLELWLGPADTLGSLSRSSEGGIHIIERVIFNHSFPRLQYCSLGAEWSKLSPSLSGILVTFLSSLHSLRQLKLSEQCSSLNLPSTYLPCLTSFRGSPGAAGCLLPGRPVQFLSLVGQDSDVSRENLFRITQTSIPLKYLDLSGMSVRPVLLSNIAAYLPNIEVLKVKLALRHTLHYALSGIRLLTGLSSVLNAFHHLMYLDLSSTPVAGAPHTDIDQELGLCREWSRACPSLRRIIFPSQTEWILYEDGQWFATPV